MQAIPLHSFSSNQYCSQISSAQLFYVLTTNSVGEPQISGTFCNSEANTVINNFNYLSTPQQQDLLNFLRVCSRGTVVITSLYRPWGARRSLEVVATIQGMLLPHPLYFFLLPRDGRHVVQPSEQPFLGPGIFSRLTK